MLGVTEQKTETYSEYGEVLREGSNNAGGAFRRVLPDAHLYFGLARLIVLRKDERQKAFFGIRD